MCGMSCVSLESDQKHCGKCNEKCNDKAMCISGKCEELDGAEKDKGGKGEH
jgi:hypothetical protein